MEFAMVVCSATQSVPVAGHDTAVPPLSPAIKALLAVLINWQPRSAPIVKGPSMKRSRIGVNVEPENEEDDDRAE